MIAIDSYDRLPITNRFPLLIVKQIANRPLYDLLIGLFILVRKLLFECKTSIFAPLTDRVYK